MQFTIFIVSFFLILVFGGSFAVEYNATWESLDSRPLPSWFDEAKVGIFVHWGVYSVPSFGDEWFWWQWRGSQSEEFVNFMKNNYPPNFTYQDFARDFTAEFFNPDEWAEIFKNSGAKYVVLTSKHHEGFHLWPSKYSYSWNSVDVGPKRDIVGDLGNAVRDKGLHFGVYHSLYEWFHPLYIDDWANNYETSAFVDAKIIPEMKELVELYKPDLLWSDGDWEAPDTYWKSKEFLQWLYNESPVKDVVVTNDRWGSGTGCAHGGYLSCADRYNPGFLLPRKWENAMPLDWGSWGYRRTTKLSDIVYIQDLIKQLASTVSCGGNILINIGPTKDGSLIPIFQERLRDLGEWLSINGDGIYGTEPWTAQNDTLTPGVWYTSKGVSVYAIVLNWPSNNLLALRSVKPLFSMNSIIEVSLLGNENLEVKVNESPADSVVITFPDKAKVASQWAWVLKFTH